MKKQIKWKTILVEVSKIKPTPNNYKIKTEDGSARFDTSIESYGLAGVVILNADYTLIDGNTRVDKAKKMGLKKIEASMPDRKLTPKEFTEFAAMYDMARAGEVDIKRIKDELGTADSFFKKWGMEIPKASLEKLKEFEAQEAQIKANAKTPDKQKKKEDEMRQLTLVYTSDQADELINIAESMYSRLKVDNLSDAILKVLKEAKKAKR